MVDFTWQLRWPFVSVLAAVEQFEMVVLVPLVTLKLAAVPEIATLSVSLTVMVQVPY